MERKTFLRTVFALAFLKGLADMQGILPEAAVAAPVAPAAESLPGIDGQCFKIKFGRNWFFNFDVVVMNSTSAKYHYLMNSDAEGAVMKKISGPESAPERIEVSFYESDDLQKQNIENLAERLCNALPL